jgi:pimeloyl-ACP methyl ester carboxylesterase
MSAIRFVKTSLLDMAYFDHGAASGFPLILLHGWPDDARTWDRVGRTLTAAGFRCIVPYLRGFGPTKFLDADTMRSGQLAALGQDVVEFTGALGLGKFALIGHVWGARAAAIAATEMQDTGKVSHLVLLSVGYGTNSPDQQLPLKQIQNYWYHWYMALPRGLDLVRNQRKEFTRYIWDIWAPDWQFTDAEFEATAQSFDNPDWFDVVINSYRHRWGYAQGDPRYDGLERRLNPAPIVTVPTLLLHGAADPCNDPLTSEGKERFFSAAYERKLVPNAGHFPQREKSDLVAAEILAWLAV